MFSSRAHSSRLAITAVACVASWVVLAQSVGERSSIADERAMPRHLRDGEEFTLPLPALLDVGRIAFAANWTTEDGAGRPLTKGTGRPVADPTRRLEGRFAFNRISAPDASSCAGCHNNPYGITGGSGDHVTNVFLLAQRFDFTTFDAADRVPTRGAVDETGNPTKLEDAANIRSSTGMFGAGYLEMLARQMTEELQRIRDSIRHGETKELVAKGIAFGKLTLTKTGVWDTSQVKGLSRLSLLSTGTVNPPTLVIRPWHQAGNVVSIREFTNNAFNHHHGIQSTERFGLDTDPDGDGFTNELTRADVTAVSVWQATLQVPGRVIPRNPTTEQAVLLGERTFERIGCASCHVPRLTLERQGWIYSEPNPFNPATNLRSGEVRDLKVDLASDVLPAPRLKPESTGPVVVEAFTDFKLHDMCEPGEKAERIDMNQSQWSKRLLEGNCRFLTKRLWGAANEPPFFHHGQFTTLREAVLAHAGEGKDARVAFERATKAEQHAVIEFLKTLQVLPPGTKDRIVDERFLPRPWPPSEPSPAVTTATSMIGEERAIPDRLASGAEFKLPLAEVIAYGKRLFTAAWTTQDGVGRPLMKGNGKRLSDPSQPLDGSRRFNRISGPEANACSGCHNAPYAIAGGSGEFVTSTFEQAQRFDFVTFDPGDAMPTRGRLDEARRPASLQTVGNLRSTPGLLGAGFLEALSRQMTQELRARRDALKPGGSTVLVSKGVSFGVLARRADGSWDTTRIEGLPPASTVVPEGGAGPSLLIRPWHQSGTVVSLRDFINKAYIRHHGIQTTERFGVGTDPDGDGVRDEMSRIDVTAVALFLATLPVPGRVIPRDAAVERAVLTGEDAFTRIGCASCHVPSLPLERSGWTYTEPGPFNPRGTLRQTGNRVLGVDLTDASLPAPRLETTPRNPHVVHVPAYTDFKLHDITDPHDPTAQEPIDMNQREGSVASRKGNRKFLTRRLWGAANEPPYFHHGLFTTLREAILAHAGEALEQRRAFDRLPAAEQDALIAFLKTLQVLPPGTKSRIVDEKHQPRSWPPSPVVPATTISERTR